MEEGNIKRFVDHCKEIWEYRDVTLVMMRRIITGRYKSTAIGFGWNLLTPVLLILIINLVFTTIRPRNIDDFWIYLSAGMFPVTFMSGCLRGNAITSGANYIKKMYFPREILVIANVLSQLVTLIFAFLIVILVILISGQIVDWGGMLFLFVALFMMTMFGIGCSFILSTATVFVKDVGNFASSMMRLISWITPTFFFTSDATGILSIIVWWNPFTYFVEIFHAILYYKTFPDLYLIGVAACITLFTFIAGWAFFAKMQDRFPEVM